MHRIPSPRAVERRTSRGRHLRLALGALTGAAAIAAVPAVASASTTCSYDAATSKATILMAPPSGAQVAVGSLTDGRIAYRDGTGSLGFCRIDITSPVGHFVGDANTNIVKTLVIKSANPDGLDDVVLDAAGTGFHRTDDNISSMKIFLLTGRGSDRLTVAGRSIADGMSITGGLFSTIHINGMPVQWTVSSPGKVVLNGGDGNDSLHSGFSPPFPVQLNGGSGEDTVTESGILPGDVLSGGPGNDYLSSLDGKGDIVEGGDGVDRGFADTVDFVIGMEQVTRQPVGILRLSPRTIRATAGKKAKLRLSWRTPGPWRDLSKVELRLVTSNGRKQVGTIALRPGKDRITSSGAIDVLDRGTTLSHKRKTVSADLAVRLAASVADEQLDVQVQATDIHGRSQIEPAAARISVTR